jgi:hypothetical protein
MQGKLHAEDVFRCSMQTRQGRPHTGQTFNGRKLKGLHLASLVVTAMIWRTLGEFEEAQKSSQRKLKR